jgi:general secretion pathway protein B
MSFILDALKKSELERQRQSAPGLVDSGAARPRSRLPAWAIALGSLLAVNLIVLLFVLTRGTGNVPRAVTPGAVAPPAPAPHAAPAPAEDGHFSPLEAPVYAPEIPAASLPASEAPRPVTTGVAGNSKVGHRDPLLSDEDYKSDDDEVLPTINEINLTGAQALPELHLDVHVFATKSAERFVYVNMRKYHEGATLQEGPSIERIRRDGVVLRYQGLRFLLPRQ